MTRLKNVEYSMKNKELARNPTFNINYSDDIC